MLDSLYKVLLLLVATQQLGVPVVSSAILRIAPDCRSTCVTANACKIMFMSERDVKNG